METNRKSQYLSNFYHFINLISGVDLNYDQLIAMLWNVGDDEFNVWLEEFKTCYAGTIYEGEANAVFDRDMLAYFLIHIDPVTC